jgi:predicted metal-dependent phosphoesterase TrpH
MIIKLKRKKIMKLIDLHTHTTASDGSLSPGELVRHARKVGLTAIAITDHDTVEGVDEALDQARHIDVEVIPGVEIGVDFASEMHILGYFPNRNHLNIKTILEKLRNNRQERNPKMIRKLNELGINISLDEVEKEAGGNIVARPHFAGVMVKKGYVSSVKEAFDAYLTPGKPAYVKKDKLTPEEGIGKIIDAGGIPVLAHPIYLGMQEKQLDDLLTRLTVCGLKGIEAYYVDNSDEQTEELLMLAEKHKLLVTGGSDFHGAFKPDIELGSGRGNLRIPYILLDRLKH